MTAKNSAGQAVALAGATTFFLEGADSSTVTGVTYNSQGSLMTVTLADGHSYLIQDINPSQYNFFKTLCNV